MDIIKKRWNNFTVQKRLKDLWDDYLEVSHLKDDPQTLKKFKKFLDQANETIKVYVTTNECKEKLQELLGDTGMVLDNILEYLNQFQQIQNRPEKSETGQLLQDIFEQCLHLAEFILKDPQYRKSVESTHNLLGEFLNLMEKAQNNESKVIIIKLLVMFSETVNQRIEFFEQHGFHRLLQIVMTRDPKLSRVISKALLHFLSLEDISSVDFDIQNSTCENDQQFQSIKTKISKIALDFRKFAFIELQKIFIKKIPQEGQNDELLDVPLEITLEDFSLKNALLLPISYEKIFETDLALYLITQTSRSTSEIQEEDKQDLIESPNQFLDIKPQSDDLISQFQMLQGGFKAILEILMKATDEVQVDLMTTIKKLLTSNSRNKTEFKKINGYDLLNSLFVQKENESQELVSNLFQFLLVLITDDTFNQEIQDHDAFILLLELLSFSNSEQVMLCAYETLDCLIQSNWKNIIIAKRLKISYYLILIQMRYFYGSDEINELINQLPNDSIKSGFQSCIKQKQFALINCGLLAPQLQTIMLQIAQLEGIYSFEAETIFSTIASHQIQRGIIDDTSYYLRQLYNILNLKMSRAWKSIHSFDHLAETLFKNLAIIFTKSYQKFTELNNQPNQSCIQDCILNFIDVLQLINKFLSLKPSSNKDIVILSEGNPHFIQNLISQNRWEQFYQMLEPQTKILIENLKGFLKLFDFEMRDKIDLVNSVLQYRLNLVLLQSLCQLMKNFDCFYSKMSTIINSRQSSVFNNQEKDSSIDGQGIISYLVQSQYQLYLALRQQNELENPVLEIATNLLYIIDTKHLEYLVTLINFLSKSDLTDNCSCIFEGILELLKLPEVIKQLKIIQTNDQSILQYITYRSIILLHKYNSYINLYAQQLQVLELLIPNLNSDELEVMLDLIFSSETIKRIQQDDLAFSSSLCDVLSLISIHCMIGSSQGMLLDKMLTNGEYLTNILGLLENNNLQVKSQGVKTAFTIYMLNNRLKKTQNFSQKTRFMQLLSKLLRANDKFDFNNQFCSMLYKLVFWNLDNYHIQFPDNSSSVSSTMNRSQYVDILVKSQKTYLEQLTQIQKIQNTDILELFFQSLLNNSDQTYCTDVLKVFESILDSNNMNVLLDVPNFLSWFTEKHDSSICERIITKIVIFDFAKPFKQCRIVELLRKSLDSTQVENIIKNFLQSLIDNPILKGDQQNMLKNFQNLLSNLEELVGYNESVNVQVLLAINLMTSKNSPQVRALLKSINLFEIRDQLVFQILRYNLEPEKLTQVLGFTSFNQLCVQKQFKESHCMAFLIRKLLRYQDHFGLQMLIIKILKYDVAASEENQKYVAKILKNEQLICFFYPNLLPKKQTSRNFRCLSSKQNEIDQGGLVQEDDDRKQRSPPHNDVQTDDEKPVIHSLQQLGPNSTIQDFLKVFYSPEYDDDRKQIQLQIDKVLIPVESENLKINAKLNSKKNNRLQKLNEIIQQDQLITQTIINDWELKIQQKLQRSSEKTKIRLTKQSEQQAAKLEQGEVRYFQICEIQQI